MQRSGKKGRGPASTAPLPGGEKDKGRGHASAPRECAEAAGGRPGVPPLRWPVSSSALMCVPAVCTLQGGPSGLIPAACPARRTGPAWRADFLRAPPPLPPPRRPSGPQDSDSALGTRRLQEGSLISRGRTQMRMKKCRTGSVCLPSRTRTEAGGSCPGANPQRSQGASGLLFSQSERLTVLDAQMTLCRGPSR